MEISPSAAFCNARYDIGGKHSVHRNGRRRRQFSVRKSTVRLRSGLTGV